MTDHINPERRSLNMSRIRAKNTAPEVAVRRFLHKKGLRFRLHRKDLPGNPDIVLPRHKTVIFVNGCFWHQHKGCRKAALPSTNRDYWLPKLRKNVAKDKALVATYARTDWTLITIWECEIKDVNTLQDRLDQLVNKV